MLSGVANQVLVTALAKNKKTTTFLTNPDAAAQASLANWEIWEEVCLYTTCYVISSPAVRGRNGHCSYENILPEQPYAKSQEKGHKSINARYLIYQVVPGGDKKCLLQ